MKEFKFTEEDKETILFFIKNRSMISVRNHLKNLKEDKLDSFIIEEIDKDLNYQKSKLTGDFDKDKVVKWRIVGMEELKRKFKGEIKKGK